MKGVNYAIDAGSLEDAIRKGNFLNPFLSGLGVFICMFHLFILTRQELRKDPVFICISAICICDQFYCFGTLIWGFTELIVDDECEEFVPWHQVVRICVLIWQQVARNMALVWTVCMSVLKLLSIRINNALGILVSAGVFVVSVTWSVWMNLHYSIELHHYNLYSRGCPPILTFELSMDPLFYRWQRSVNCSITLVLLIFLSFTTVMCLFKIRKLVRFKNEEDDHIASCFLLSLSFFIAELLNFGGYLFEKTVLNPSDSYNKDYYIHLLDNIQVIITANIILRCFICRFTSSEYIAAVQKYGWNKKNKVAQKTRGIPSVPTINSPALSNLTF